MAELRSVASSAEPPARLAACRAALEAVVVGRYLAPRQSPEKACLAGYLDFERTCQAPMRSRRGPKNIAPFKSFLEYYSAKGFDIVHLDQPLLVQSSRRMSLADRVAEGLGRLP